MKKKKVLTALLCALLGLVLALTGCSLGEEGKAAEVVDNFLLDIETNNSELRNKWRETFITLTEDEEAAETYLNLVYNNATHTIDDVVVNEDGTAQVTVTVQCKYLDEAVDAWTMAIDGASDSELSSLGAQGAYELFVSEIENSPSQANVIVVELEQTENGWDFIDEEQFSGELWDIAFSDRSLVLITGLSLL